MCNRCRVLGSRWTESFRILILCLPLRMSLSGPAGGWPFCFPPNSSESKGSDAQWCLPLHLPHTCRFSLRDVMRLKEEIFDLVTWSPSIPDGCTWRYFLESRYGPATSGPDKNTTKMCLLQPRWSKRLLEENTQETTKSSAEDPGEFKQQ